MKSALPLTIQDDIEAKEKLVHKQRVNCSSRRFRLWFLLIFVFVFSVGLVKYSGFNYNRATSIALTENQIIKNNQKTPQLLLREELIQDTTDHPLVVYSKTYCPYSQKAKKILKSYGLKPFKVVEVDLRKDDYEVKMALQEISGRATFPNIFLQGKTIGGCDDLEILHESGRLRNMLMQANLLEQ
ncbi:thioredoxin-like protein [Sporodiniella umbellata]|nr:thioredoxin-like protein [Sporodiniella umbellata]